jgi:hypothetical protein
MRRALLFAVATVAAAGVCGCLRRAPTSAPADVPEDPPPANGLMFQPPAGWKKTARPGSGTVFFDAPELKPGEECRIAVGRPMEFGGDFRAWFALVQEPADVVEESPVQAGTGRAKTETLRLTKVVEKGVEKPYRLYRVYHGVRAGDQFALLLFTAKPEDVFRSHLPTFNAVAASWDPRGTFPKGEETKPGD